MHVYGHFITILVVLFVKIILLFHNYVLICNSVFLVAGLKMEKQTLGLFVLCLIAL